MRLIFFQRPPDQRTHHPRRESVRERMHRRNAVDVDKFSTGRIYAIVAYIWTFIASTDYIPGLMESMTAVRELNVRLKEEVI